MPQRNLAQLEDKKYIRIKYYEYLVLESIIPKVEHFAKKHVGIIKNPKHFHCAIESYIKYLSVPRNVSFFEKAKRTIRFQKKLISLQILSFLEKE